MATVRNDMVTVEYMGRDTVKVEVPGRPDVAYTFGSIHDRGVAGAPQPVVDIPKADWKGLMTSKVVRSMVNDRKLRII